MERESMDYDVVIVGAGPAGLATAIKLRQMSIESGRGLSVCVLEKASEVGGHILSGAVFEPAVLTELFPDWATRGAPLDVPVTREKFMFLTEKRGFDFPLCLLPQQMHNHGNYVVSLGNLCRWLATQAEELGVEIYPGFAATEVLFHADGRIKGVATGDMGVSATGTHKDSYMPGMALHGTYSFFAEGCRGSLSEQVMERFDLRKSCDPQTYGLGLKEIWELDPAQYKPGTVIHTAGWPMDRATWGGSFIYHLAQGQAAVGYVVGLDYQNPHLSPFDEFQRFKTHPKIAALLAGGKRLSFGARALNEGGLQSVPDLAFPGGVMVGCAAGFLDVAKIKGSHNAMKTGIMAAESAFAALCADEPPAILADYPRRYRDSQVYRDLYTARNFRPAHAKFGLWGGMLYSALDLKLLGGRLPWTLHHRGEDRQSLRPAEEMPKIDYPKPDGVLSFDRLSSLYLSGTNHADDQPVHLVLKDDGVPVSHNLGRYDAPEQRYCPAGVYEIINSDTAPRLQINAQNCLHCKTCDIKDPTGNIKWVPPEGSGGPNYPNM